MWYNVTNELVWTLPALIYLIELRSTKFVHPTLRKIAHLMWNYLQHKYNIKLFLDNEWVEFDIRRWKQDIILKNQ